MGRLFALCGPSGVGKTTFLNALADSKPTALRLLPRATSRTKRPTDEEGREYVFLTRSGFLQKIFASDFVHVEHYGGDLFGIEARPIQDSIASGDDAIIMAGAFGATRLRDVFGRAVTIAYMYPGPRSALMSADWHTDDDPCLGELKRRLLSKVKDRIIAVDDAAIESYCRARMEFNHVELAYMNGRLRSGELVTVLENPKNHLDKALEEFARLRGLTHESHLDSGRVAQCFVLMPFKESLLPIYDDHIVPVVNRLGLTCLRADRIFSNRPIMDDVLDSVHRARLVIADLTQANPNVFYEMGICHALGKDVILMTQDADVPFDVRHIRHIRYEFTPRGMKRFEDQLDASIRTILQS